MSKNKKEKEKSMYEVYKSVRGSWNGVNPVPRIVESKKHKKPKHKDKQFDEE